MTAPLANRFQAVAAPVGATADDSTIVGQAPYAATATSVLYIPKATQNGAATNNRTLSVVNRGGGAGTGSTVIATVTLNSGTNLVDNVPTALTLSSVSGALTIASGDVLEFTSVHNGTGVADPGGLVVVAHSRS